MQAAVEAFHLRHVPHRMHLVVALCHADRNLLVAQGAAAAEQRVYVTDGVVWWGRHQVIADESVPRGRVRLLVDGASMGA
jgi:hypothetical protein